LRSPPEALLHSFFEWMFNTGYGTTIRESLRLYPMIMSLHLICIAVFGATILMTDLRLLGLVMKSRSVTDMVGQLRVIKVAGLLLMLSAGISLLFANAEEYYENPFFWIKMCLLLMILIHYCAFRRSVYRNTKAIDRAPLIPKNARIAAILSLVLWTGVLLAGRAIGYYETPNQGPPAHFR
jgi:uncharacterized membrane protein